MVLITVGKKNSGMGKLAEVRSISKQYRTLTTHNVELLILCHHHPPVDLMAIVTAAINAAAQGIAAATIAQSAAGAATSPTPLSLLKILHLLTICGVATGGGIPDIWMEVAGTTTKQAGLALLVQFLVGEMSVCHRDFLGHSESLHCFIPLYNFIASNHFVNPGENPACLAGGGYMWMTLQGKEDVGKRMASADAILTALDIWNAVTDQIALVARVHLQTIFGATMLQREIGTKTYMLSKLFGTVCPFFQGYAYVVTWIDENFASFERQVSTTALCTSSAYNLSQTEAMYYNACIRESTTALMGDPGYITPVSFAMLLDELTWGRYRGQPLPASLHFLLHPANAPCPTYTVTNISIPSVAPTPARVDPQNAQGLPGTETQSRTLPPTHASASYKARIREIPYAALPYPQSTDAPSVKGGTLLCHAGRGVPGWHCMSYP